MLSWDDMRSNFPHHFGWEMDWGHDDDSRFSDSARSSRKQALLATFTNQKEVHSDWQARELTWEAYAALLGYPRPTPRMFGSSNLAHRARGWFLYPRKQAYFESAEVRGGLAVDTMRFIKAMMKGRVLFTTREGAMRIGPASIMRGDFVFSVPDDLTSIVLRPFDRSSQDPPEADLQSESRTRHMYRMVGDCHLSGDELQTQVEDEQHISDRFSLGTSFYKVKGDLREVVLI